MFDLYFAGIQALELDEYLSSKNCNRLFSYADKPKKRLQMFDKTSGKVFMDSGAFGVAHSKKEITLDEYIQFINETPRVNLFANLDVIPWPELNVQTAEVSAKQSWDNYVYMLEHVNTEYLHKIVPVYHYGEEFKWLEKILNGHNGYKPSYIAFGGRGGVHTKKLYNSLDTFFKIVKDINPQVKVHAFGITVLDILSRYPFTSADSTSYLKTAVNGGIYLDCLKRTLKISTQTKKDPLNYLHLDNHLKQIVKQEIEKYGYTDTELQENFRSRFRFNIDYFIRWQKNYKYNPISKIVRKSLF